MPKSTKPKTEFNILLRMEEEESFEANENRLMKAFKMMWAQMCKQTADSRNVNKYYLLETCMCSSIQFYKLCMVYLLLLILLVKMSVSVFDKFIIRILHHSHSLLDSRHMIYFDFSAVVACHPLPPQLLVAVKRRASAEEVKSCTLHIQHCCCDHQNKHCWECVNIS